MLAAVLMALAGAGRGESGAGVPQLLVPPVALTANDIAVVINDADPASVEVGLYYARVRGVRPEHVIHVSFAPDRAALTREEFAQVQAQLDGAVPARVQAYALAWTQPYRVDCMSITAAFAFGFHEDHCAGGCQPTRPSPYFDSHSTMPYRDFGMRPAMLLAARDVGEARQLIARGARSDGQWPRGKAYLVSTSDRARNVRAADYEHARTLLGATYPIEQVNSDSLQGRGDVMFYFTGLTRVPDIETNRFLDGAIADHLTSAGGMLIDSPQMSALDWIHAGATASYGTAHEPCNFRQKFPDVSVVIGRYLGGETLIEAYWKSVQMPGQGVFIGEPLARPFGGVRSQPSGDAVDVQTRSLRPGRYQLQVATSPVGPFRTVGALDVVRLGPQTLRLPRGSGRTYRLIREPARSPLPPPMP